MTRHIRALIWPLWGRLLHGEGGLWLAGGSLVFVRPHTWDYNTLQIALLGILLWTLYLFNDLVDIRTDRHNPRKNQFVVETYAAARTEYWILWGSVSVLCMGTAYWLEAASAVWVIFVILINIAYSCRLKSIPGSDISTVGAWGAAYAAVAAREVHLCLAVGCMTMIAHVYQTRADRKSDSEQGIRTIAVLAPQGSRILVTFVALAMAAVVYHAGGTILPVGLAMAVAAPIWLFQSNQWAWHGSRCIFGASWIAWLTSEVAR